VTTHPFPIQEDYVTTQHDIGETALSETVNLRSGLIRASGHLTRQGADLLRGTADSLRSSGHSHVVLDLQDVRDADAAGLDILRTLRRSFAASGDSLLIRHAPQGD
jgi:anti-anti-sigma regulatory factor